MLTSSLFLEGSGSEQVGTQSSKEFLPALIPFPTLKKLNSLAIYSRIFKFQRHCTVQTEETLCFFGTVRNAASFDQ